MTQSSGRNQSPSAITAASSTSGKRFTSNAKKGSPQTSPAAKQPKGMAATPHKEVLAAGGSNVNKVSFLRVEDLVHLSQTDQQGSSVNSVAFNDRQFVFGLADSTVHADNYRIN